MRAAACGCLVLKSGPSSTHTRDSARSSFVCILCSKVVETQRRERNNTQPSPETLSLILTMAEVAGLVLSALTVGPVVSQGAAIALELYGAPKDIGHLWVSSHVTVCQGIDH